MTYSEKLKYPRWQKKRLEILNRDNWTCQLCGDTETEFHVHHKKYTKEPWDAPEEDLISYCKHCHLMVEVLVSSGLSNEILKVIKYNKQGEYGDRLLVCYIKKTPDLVSLFFAIYYEDMNKLGQIINMSPAVIRDTNAELDKIKELFKIETNG